MKKLIKMISFQLLFLLPTSLWAWQWHDLWQTKDQQAHKLLQAGSANAAAKMFKNKDWQATAFYRAKNYQQAFSHFSKQNTSDGQYNAGNAAAFLGRYPVAIDLYDKALALNPQNTDAKINREIIKKIMEQEKQQNKSNAKKADNSQANKESKPQENKSAENNKDANSQKNKTEMNSAQKNKNKNNNDQKTNQHKQQQTAASNNSQQENQQQQQRETQTKASRTQKLTKAQAAQQSENQNQVLRRLPEDPGGLLRQKFLRDYFRRHATQDRQGDNG